MPGKYCSQHLSQIAGEYENCCRSFPNQSFIDAIEYIPFKEAADDVSEILLTNPDIFKCQLTHQKTLLNVR